MLPRCLLLAALLHVWLALMLGNKANPLLDGRSGWGSLSVELRGPSRPGAGTPGAALWRDDGPPGDAPSPRHGGRLREQAPPPDAGPGAIREGRWKAQELPPDPSRPEFEESGSQGHAAIERETSAAPPRLSAAGEAAPPLRAERVEASPAALREPFLPALPQAAELPSVGRLEAVEPARRPAMPSEPLALRSGLSDAPLSAPPSADALPRPPDPVLQAAPSRPPVARDSLPAIDTVPNPSLLRELPALGALPEPAPTLRTLAPAAAQRLPRQREALGLPADAAATRPSAGLAPAPAVDTLPSVGRLSSAPDLDPRATASSLDRAPQLEAPALSGLNATPLASRLPTEAPAGVSSAAEPPGPLTRGDPLADPQPGPRASAGSPDAGARVGHDVATAPSAAASAPLRPLNLNLPRGMAGPRRGGPGLIEVLPGLPERPKTAMEKAVEEAGRDDCRKAHGDKGLLALAPLALETLRGKGCKW